MWCVLSKELFDFLKRLICFWNVEVMPNIHDEPVNKPKLDSVLIILVRSKYSADAKTPVNREFPWVVGPPAVS